MSSMLVEALNAVKPWLSSLRSLDINMLELAKMIVPYDHFRTVTNVQVLLLVHVLFYALLLGAMVWQTLVSGIVLFKALPRAEFSRAQSALFPVYFRFTSFCLAALAVCVFLEQHDIDLVRHSIGRMFAESQTRHTLAEILAQFLRPLFTLTIHNVHLGLLILALSLALTQQFILGPLTTRAMYARHRFNEQLAKSPNDVALQKKAKSANGRFGMVHGFSSLYNLIILLIVVAHGLYFASAVATYIVPIASGVGKVAAAAKGKKH